MTRLSAAQKMALKDVRETLIALDKFLSNDAAVHPGALLHDDECTIEEHIAADLLNIGRAFPEIKESFVKFYERDRA